MQDDPWAATGVREGDVLAGKYRVERVLGVGGMGVVVSARHVQLDEPVAIKFLLPHMSADVGAVQRFLREAKAAVRIKNEHVVRVFDVGTLPSGAPYMVMELLEGGDLAAWLSTRGAMPIEQAVDFVLQTCVALADAHAMGIVHRDLKPSNLFCVRRSDGQLTVKVLDFGISKVLDAGAADGGMSMTKTSAIMGSPLYMSPEQMRSSKDVDARTDIWALGVILYELLTATPPFDGTTLTEVAVKVATEPHRPLYAARPDVPPALETALAGCLQKDPRARYAHVGELALALAPFASPRGRASVERIASVSASAEMPPTMSSVVRPQASGNMPRADADTVPPVGRTAFERILRPSRIPWLVAGLFAVLVLAGGWAALRHVGRAVTPNVPVAVVAAPPPPPASSPAVVSVAPLALPPPVALPPEPPSSSAARPARVESRPKGTAAAREPARAIAHDAGAPEATPKPAASCNPPYFVDAAGHRQYKPECL